IQFATEDYMSMAMRMRMPNGCANGMVMRDGWPLRWSTLASGHCRVANCQPSASQRVLVAQAHLAPARQIQYDCDRTNAKIIHHLMLDASIEVCSNRGFCPATNWSLSIFS